MGGAVLQLAGCLWLSGGQLTATLSLTATLGQLRGSGVGSKLTHHFTLVTVFTGPAFM